MLVIIECLGIAEHIPPRDDSLPLIRPLIELNADFVVLQPILIGLVLEIIDFNDIQALAGVDANKLIKFAHFVNLRVSAF